MDPDTALATVLSIARLAEIRKANDKRTFLEKKWDNFRLNRSSERLTSSQKRKLKREADVLVTYFEAFNNARVYCCKMVETDERGQDDKGNETVIWRRGEEDHVLYLAWRDVYINGYGEVDGKKVVCSD